MMTSLCYRFSGHLGPMGLSYWLYFCWCQLNYLHFDNVQHKLPTIWHYKHVENNKTQNMSPINSLNCVCILIAAVGKWPELHLSTVSFELSCQNGLLHRENKYYCCFFYTWNRPPLLFWLNRRAVRERGNFKHFIHDPRKRLDRGTKESLLFQ